MKTLKSKIVFWCLTALVFLFICDGILLEDLVKEGGTINGRIILKKNKQIRRLCESYQFVEGNLLGPNEEIGEDVIIKVFSKYTKEAADEEYKTLTYLKAINNSSVKQFGIPSVLYYDKWEDGQIIAFSRENAFYEFPEKLQNNDMDTLFLFKLYVTASKYMRICGIDIDKDLFLVFSKSTTTSHVIPQFHDTIYKHLGLKRFKIREVCARDEWRSFLYQMNHHYDDRLFQLYIRFWALQDQLRSMVFTKVNSICQRLIKYALTEYRLDYKHMMKLIKKFVSEPVRRVYLKFAEEAYIGYFKSGSIETKSLPDYDRIYHLINEAYRCVDVCNDSFADITKYDIPSTHEYPPVNYTFFSTSSKSNLSTLKNQLKKLSFSSFK